MRSIQLLQRLPLSSRVASSSLSVAGRRWAATHAPTTSSAPPQDVSTQVRLAPGEEVDPQLNGYPQLPYVSLQHREPFGWWDRQERKNFGEVVHEEEDALGMWGPDYHKISGGAAVLSLIAAFSAVAGFAYIITSVRPLRPVAAREYPYGGLEKELGGHVAARKEWEDNEE